MLERDRMETLKASLKIMLLLLCEDILFMVVKLVFTGINVLGGKYLGVIVRGDCSWWEFSGSNYLGEVFLFIIHYKYIPEDV